MIERLFHAWEYRLASVTTNRVVRAFDWGLDWIPANGHPPGTQPHQIVSAWVTEILRDTERFFHAPAIEAFARDGDAVTFPSALTTPHAVNNLVRARYFPARRSAASQGPRRAVLVLPQWNAGPDGHVGLCRLLSRVGLSALRLSLPYHDDRMPAELQRADYIVSANVARTVQVCRQAVLDARRAIDWLEREGYQRIGIMGTSLGSCLAMLATAHDRRIRAAALNHVSPYFADVVWHGLSTSHVRTGLDGHIDLATLRDLWRPISPQTYLDRVRHARILLVYALYDLTFPTALSKRLIDEFEQARVACQVARLPCGHYTTGIAPFSWLDGYYLTRFLTRALA